MIAVVTGGSGFIGQHLVRRLLAEGHEVRCLVRRDGRPTPPGAVRFVVQFESPASLLDCEALEDAAVVFHLAGATRATRPDDFVRANVLPARHLLGALAARGSTARFVYISSQAAAGPASSATQPIDEDDAPRPVEAYGLSKLEGERIVTSFGDRIPFTIVRPCAVIGPRDRDFLTLFRLAERGIIVYPGTATHWLSLLAVHDVVSGILVAAQSDRAILRTYFLSSVQPVRWRTVGEHIAAAVGRQVRHVDVPLPVIRVASRAADVVGRLMQRAWLANTEKAKLARHPYWVCSSERARRELGFSESRSLPEAITATYLWYRRNGWLRRSPERRDVNT